LSDSGVRADLPKSGIRPKKRGRVGFTPPSQIYSLSPAASNPAPSPPPIPRIHAACDTSGEARKRPARRMRRKPVLHRIEASSRVQCHLALHHRASSNKEVQCEAALHPTAWSQAARPRRRPPASRTTRPPHSKANAAGSGTKFKVIPATSSKLPHP